MSLESAIQENTQTLRELIAIWSKSPMAPDTTPSVDVLFPLPTETIVIQEAIQPTLEITAPVVIDYPTISEAITNGVKKNRDHVVAILAKFGVKKGTELKSEQYPSFLAALA
jgi:hypothetical protein